MRKRIASRSGFTLIELIVVVVIIGILSAIALPRYQKSVEQSRKAEAYTVLKAIHGAQVRYAVEKDLYTSDSLDISVADTKYFTFVELVDSPSPTDASDSVLACAQRTSSERGTLSAYCIMVNESGAIWESSAECPGGSGKCS